MLEELTPCDEKIQAGTETQFADGKMLLRLPARGKSIALQKYIFGFRHTALARRIDIVMRTAGKCAVCIPLYVGSWELRGFGRYVHVAPLAQPTTICY